MNLDGTTGTTGDRSSRAAKRARWRRRSSAGDGRSLIRGNGPHPDWRERLEKDGHEDMDTAKGTRSPERP